MAHETPLQPEGAVTNEMVDNLAGYLDNIAAAATTAGKGTELADLAASLAILVATNATQAKELKQMREQLNTLRNNQRSDSQPTCTHCVAVGRKAPHSAGACFFDPKNNKGRPNWAKELMKAKGVEFDDKE